SGYLLLAKKMWESPAEYCEGWNFGPEEGTVRTVRELASGLVEKMGRGELKTVSTDGAVHEAGLLLLDIGKAKSRLGWKPRLDMDGTIGLVADWYERYRKDDVCAICIDEINRFLS
ncbi:MAG: CDP-glucose 4,6-dehydratase, partial [Bacteroidales bacterium]|nr:CDP-glucose 4,6-dehydratase [Bacteroidales bacterium]